MKSQICFLVLVLIQFSFCQSDESETVPWWPKNSQDKSINKLDKPSDEKTLTFSTKGIHTCFHYFLIFTLSCTAHQTLWHFLRPFRFEPITNLIKWYFLLPFALLFHWYAIFDSVFFYLSYQLHFRMLSFNISKNTKTSIKLNVPKQTKLNYR